MKTVFPFAAIVGQEAMKQALLVSAVDPSIGGVLVLGDRGTGKSTTVRALAALLPKIEMVKGCPYNRPPDSPAKLYPPFKGDKQAIVKRPIPVVDLPLGATEDRVVGALDLEAALVRGEKSFEPGLLAAANRGFLYIDEVNLLEDHLVDLLLDVAASGENAVEREGLSVRHPARFVLIGSGNPEEGELRPQLLDRFGLAVDITTPTELSERVEVIRRRDDFDRDPAGFRRRWARREGAIRKKILTGREKLDAVEVPTAVLEDAARLCLALETDGLRGELTLIRAARALAAYHGRDAVTTEDLRTMSGAALGHRLRRNPLDESRALVRVERAVEEVFE
ncbi:MAG: magnesium chelatase ATPase subunit I [Pseudomonadota bacterium]